MITIPFKTDEDKDRILSEYSDRGYFLKETQMYKEGNFLLFGPPTDYHEWDSDIEDWAFNVDLWLDDDVRPIRNILLLASDYHMLTDIVKTIDASLITLWETYRQTLRDIPQNLGKLSAPVSIPWPNPPQSMAKQISDLMAVYALLIDNAEANKKLKYYIKNLVKIRQDAINIGIEVS